MLNSSNQKRYHYTVYGLQLQSNRAIPELIQTTSQYKANNPVNIHFVEDLKSLPIKQPVDKNPWFTDPNKNENGVPGLQVWHVAESYYLAYLCGSHFIVERDGNNIWAAWAKGVDFGLITAQILGPILGFILQLHERLVLHASVLAWSRKALAILGTRGAGKSTTAAALLQLGCQVISDDIAAISYEKDTWWVSPGYPRLRLWPQTAAALYGPNHDLPRIAPDYEYWEKRYLEINRESTDFVKVPVALTTIYVLNWNEANNKQTMIDPLTGVNALANLDANAYLDYLLDRDQRQRQIAAIKILLDRISVYQIQPVADLAVLSDLGRAILNHFKQTI